MLPRPPDTDKHAVRLLQGYTGVLQTDGYAAYRSLADPKRAGGPATLAFCWAHWLRQWFDIAKSPPAPTASEALKRIAELYEIEAEIRGKNQRAPARATGKDQTPRRRAEDLAEQTLVQVASASSIAQAFRYMRARWTALLRCFDDGRLALDNNPAERALRCVAIGRKNYLLPAPMPAAVAPPHSIR